MNSAQVREGLADALKLDLVGPEPGGKHESETLPMAPSKWYLTGYLVPFMAPESQKREMTADDELDLVGSVGVDDDTPPERASGRKVFLPSSIGMSVLVSPETKSLRAKVQWGDYRLLEVVGGVDGGSGATRSVQHWQRTQRAEAVDVPLPAANGKSTYKEIPNSD